MNFTIQSWERQLNGLPFPTSPKIPIRFEIEEPVSPGSVYFDQVEIPMNGELIQIRFFYVFPEPKRQLPKYYNIDINSPSFFCSMAPRSDGGLLPPIACGSNFEQIARGVTLTHVNLESGESIKKN